MTTQTKTRKGAGKKPVATITTETPRNPRNVGAYALESVPPSGSDKSRFSLHANFEGHCVPNAEAIARAYTELAQARVKQTPELTPEPKIVPLWYIGRNEAQEVVRVPRGTVKRSPTLEVQRSGRFTSAPKETGGALLDRLFLELAGPDVRDQAIVDALAQMIDEENITDPSTLLSLNNSTSLLMLTRAGIAIEPSELPAPGTPH
jgi:hypothetical protein